MQDLVAFCVVASDSPISLTSDQSLEDSSSPCPFRSLICVLLLSVGCMTLWEAAFVGIVGSCLEYVVI